MQDNPLHLPRRGFIKGLGAATLLPFLPLSTFSTATAPGFHRVLSCNIRVALPEDEEKGVGWPQRKDGCIKVIKKQKPDIVCFQEVLKVQAEDIRRAFPRYCLFGFDGPEMDAHQEGYHGIAKNPVLFDTDRYELLSGGNYWLSETPLIAGSMSWGTARARSVNWLRLRDRKTGQAFRVVNLHLDHISGEAKIQQAKMVAEESSQYQPDFPQILAGDFNARATSKVFDSLRDAGWQDSYAAVHGAADPGYTVHGFEGAAYTKGAGKGKIDFIFCKGSVKAQGSTIIKDAVNGRYPSDHYFLSADLMI